MLAASALVCLVVENSSLLTTLHCIPLALIKPLCIRALQTFVEQPSVYVCRSDSAAAAAINEVQNYTWKCCEMAGRHMWYEMAGSIYLGEWNRRTGNAWNCCRRRAMTMTSDVRRRLLLLPPTPRFAPFSREQ